MVAIQATTTEIYLATPADDAVVTTLFEALHVYNAGLDDRFTLAEGWPSVLADHLAHERATGESTTFIAWRDGEPVGLLMVGGHTDSPLFRQRHWAEILALYIVPNLRGSGLADDMIDAAISWARDRGYGRIQLFVTATNIPARRFYHRSHFAPIQEIWCRSIGLEAANLPEDEQCEAAYERGEQLLAPSTHPVHT